MTQSELKTTFRHHGIDGYEVHGCFDRSFRRSSPIPPLFCSHDPCLLHLENLPESTRQTLLFSCFRCFALLPFVWLLLQPPLPCSDDDRICFNGDLSTQVWNHHFLPRFRLSHWLVLQINAKFSSFCMILTLIKGAIS